MTFFLAKDFLNRNKWHNNKRTPHSCADKIITHNWNNALNLSSKCKVLRPFLSTALAKKCRVINNTSHNTTLQAIRHYLLLIYLPVHFLVHPRGDRSFSEENTLTLWQLTWFLTWDFICIALYNCGLPQLGSWRAT